MTSPSQDRLFGTNSSMAIKVPCRVATTADITLEGEQTIDGVAVVSGDRVLVKDQSDGTENGIYIADTSEWQRAPDFDGTRDVTAGTLTYVNGGTAGQGFWYVTTTGTIVVGTTSIAFGMASTVLAVVTAYAQTLLALASKATWQSALEIISNTLFTAKGSMLYGSAANTAATLANGIEMLLPECGRLTLTSGTAVTTSDVTGATTVYFTPYKGNVVPLYDGDTWIPTIFTELSQTTADTTKSPAAVANNSNYDIFVWNDSGTLRATRGPAWTSDTARGTGAGTTELELLEGRYVNKVAITNGPAAQRGLYVGTIRSDGSAQINDSLALRHVWNNYNRVDRAMRAALETTDSWTYTTATWRQANANTANQLDMVRGLNEDMVIAVASGSGSNSGGLAQFLTGIGENSTSALVSGALVGVSVSSGANITQNIVCNYSGFPGLGRAYLAWLEISVTTTGTTNWQGDNGQPTQMQNGIIGRTLA